MNKKILAGLILAFCIPVAVVSAQMYLPLKNLISTSAFGYRVHPLSKKIAFHCGVDLRASYDSVFAVLSGHVLTTAYNPVAGLYIQLSHSGFYSTYGHLSEVLVNPGDSVAAGQLIAISGETGQVTGPHLHFSVQYKGKYLNPLLFLIEISKYMNIKNK